MSQLGEGVRVSVLLRLTIVVGLAFGPIAVRSSAAAQAPEPICDLFTVSMSDGARLFGSRSRLAPDVPRPIQLTFTPYGAAYWDNDQCGPPRSTVNDRTTQMLVHLRGTGASEGLWDTVGPRSQQDVNEVLDWIGDQPWGRDQRLLLLGQSGSGIAMPFALRHPSVTAALARSTCWDVYIDCLRPGGVLKATGKTAYEGLVVEGYVLQLPTRLTFGLTRDAVPVQLAAIVDQVQRMASGDARDAWWQERSGLSHLAAVDVPVMFTTDPTDLIAGAYVGFEHMPGARLSLRDGHSGPGWPAGAREPRSLYDNRFIAHYLLGDDNGAERDPRVHLAIGLGSNTETDKGRFVIRGEDGWPLPSTEWTHMLLGSGGSLALEPEEPGARTIPIASTPGTLTEVRARGIANGYGSPQTGDPAGARSAAVDLRTEEAAMLTYTSEPLVHDVELTGPFVVRLFASTTTTDLDWSVFLTDVWPDGESQWITDGSLRASLRRVDPDRSRRNADGDIVRPAYPYDVKEPVPPGEPVEYLIELWPTANVFQAGHRIRLDIAPVANGGWDGLRTAGAGLATILHDAEHPSSVLLPVIPDRCDEALPILADGPAPSFCASLHVALPA